MSAWPRVLRTMLTAWMPTFREHVDEHQNRVYSFAYYLTGSREAAEDVAQEVLIRFWRHHAQIDAERVLGWLLRTTRNAAIDALRKRKTRRRLLDVDIEALVDTASQAPSPHTDAEGADVRYHLERALVFLDEPYRSIVILREVQDLQYQEISEALGLPMSTVKVYLYRARKRLRLHLAHVTGHELANSSFS